jgi:hypothetical protein
MIGAVKNLYHTQDLNGEFLVKPLKAFHSFFASKLEKSSGLAKAALGMAIKLSGVPGLRAHNLFQKGHVESVARIAKLNTSTKGGGGSSLSTTKVPVDVFTFGVKDAAKQCEAINKRIDVLTEQFQKIYVSDSYDISKSSDLFCVELNRYL